MDIQRLRNLTTGKLHTDIGHVYQDIEYLTGESGIMTHMLPNAWRALDPYLRTVVPDTRLWDGQHDPSHTGDIDVPPMDEVAKEAFWARYDALPHPFFGKRADAGEGEK